MNLFRFCLNMLAYSKVKPLCDNALNFIMSFFYTNLIASFSVTMSLKWWILNLIIIFIKQLL